MKTGFCRRVPHWTAVVAALSALSLVLALSACDDHSPVSAPTSTLPAQSPSSSPADAEPEIPEYETDLDLSPEEEEAVEGALVAFAGFFVVVNEAYSGDFKVAEEFSDYASGDALKSINGDVAVIEDGSYDFTGVVTPSKVGIQNVSATEQSSTINNVVVTFCFDLSKWSLSPHEATHGSVSEFATMEHSILRTPDGWRITEQTLKEHKC